MVKYYGRARQRTGSVNRNQLGLKMSGCPSRVGRNIAVSRYIQRRVNCMMGVCRPKGIMVHGVWRLGLKTLRNKPGHCVAPATKCSAAAGGIGGITTPYYKTNQPGKGGCFQKKELLY